MTHRASSARSGLFEATECSAAAWLLAALLILPPVVAMAASDTDVPVRVGTHEGYGRVVFYPPPGTTYHVTQQGQHVQVGFTGDLTIGQSHGVPRNVVSITGGGHQADLVVAQGAVLHSWRLGDLVVIDVLDRDPTNSPPPQPAQQGGTGSGPAPPGQALNAPPASAAIGAPPSAGAAHPKAEPASPTLEDTKARPESIPQTTAPSPATPKGAPPSATSQPGDSASVAASATQAAALSPVASPEAVPAASPVSPPAASRPAPPAALPEPSIVDSALVVPADTQTGVALFRRGGVALIVFDRPRIIDTAPLRNDPVFGTASAQTLPTATVVLVRLDAGLALLASRTGDAWRISAMPREPTPRPILATVADQHVVLAAAAPGSVVGVADPETGATLLVGTQRRDGQGIPAIHRSPEFILLPTWQGVAVVPDADTVTLRPTEQGFLIDGVHTLSPPPDVADELAHSTGLTRRFDFPDQQTPVLLQRLQQKISEDAQSPALARGPPRRAIAATMIALGLGAEAAAVLNIAATDDPHEAGSPDNVGLASIAALLAHRSDDANGLADPRLPATDDIVLWRAVSLAQRQPGSPPAAAMFAATVRLALDYPPELRRRILPLAAETMVAGGELNAAAALLRACKDDPSLDLARAMLHEAQGDNKGALEGYDRLIDSPDQSVHARAAARAVDVRLALGAIDAKQAADQLESLLYSWRGDLQERALREHLAELKARTGSWRSGLALLRETEALFPDDKAAIHGKLADMFVALVREGAADTLSALELVSVVEENADLLPAVPDAEAFQAKLADRLVALDLPKRAGAVLEKLMLAMNSGVARAGLGARLAELRLREGDPTGALDALDASVASDLPADVTERRTLLAAEADARRGDNDRALAALGALDSAPAAEARATILERSNDWPAAQRALTDYVAKSVPPDGKLDDEQRRTLLRLATASARAGDNNGLAALREREGARMGTGPMADMFRLLTADQVRGVADLKRSGQEAALAHALPGDLRALQPPPRQPP